MIEAESPFGVKVTYTIHIKTVVTAYVSDMTWAVDEKGYFANSRDMCGTNPIQLSVDGVPVTYKKGVGAHAPSRIQVDIANKEYTRFTAVAGINYNQISNNNGKSNVNFVVKKDGQEVFRKNNVGYNSNGNVFSVPVDIDVTGAKTIELIVEKGDADYNDHVSWADAKFTAIVEGNVPLPVDKSLLQYFVNKANSLNEADYTTESWTFVASTLNTAEKVLQKGASTQEEVNSAAAALKAAIDALQEKATEVEKPLVTAKLEEGRNTNQKKVAAERVTDTNLQFVRHGFIYIDTETLGGWDLTVETAGAININIPQTDENGRFNLVMTLMRKEEMYTVKAYAIYLDKQGNERYAYSDALEVLKN